MEGDYEKIREHAFQEAEKEPEKAEEPQKAMEPEKAAEPEKATDAEQSVEVEPQKKKAKAAKKAEDASLGDPGRQKPKEKPPRMICEGCGRSYSINTKRHVCKAPKGFEKKANVPPEPVPPPMPVDLQRQITLADVTQFLFAGSKARRDKRRDDLLAKMF